MEKYTDSWLFVQEVTSCPFSEKEDLSQALNVNQKLTRIP